MLLNNIKLHDLVQAFQDRHHPCFLLFLGYIMLFVEGVFACGPFIAFHPWNGCAGVGVRVFNRQRNDFPHIYWGEEAGISI